MPQRRPRKGWWLAAGVAGLAAVIATTAWSSASRSQTPVPAPVRAHPALRTAALPLAGKVIGIDPGHNGGNFNDPGYINTIVWNGRAWETCDTTGTETNGGYTEAQYNFRVAEFLRADLIRAGARVVMTRTSNSGVGPCVNRRARIIDNAHANVAIDIHADGGPPSGRGFTILEPVPDGPNNKVIGSSDRFAADLRSAFLRGTPMPVSSYDGVNGLTQRNDLAGLNLTTVPKVLIECGNMRNATDARMFTATWFQQAAARAMTAAIIRFLH
jgi:N-acetylmuramoyl-L-alanine amidase